MVHHRLFLAFCLQILLVGILPISVVGESGIAIIAERPFNPNGLGEVGHVAALFENPEDGSFRYVSIGAATRSIFAPLTKPENDIIPNLDEAKIELAKNSYGGIKIIQVEFANPDNAEKAINELSPNYALFSSIGVPSNPSVFGTGIYATQSDPTGDNCLTSTVKILNAYGADLPDIKYSTGTPLKYYNQISGLNVQEYELLPDHTYKPIETPESGSERSSAAGIDFTSIKLNYIAVNPDDSGGINVDFILKSQKAEGMNPGINPANSALIGSIAFMTGLAVPDYKFYVRLSPNEPDQIIDDMLAQSEVGRIMLEADLQMKKDIHHYDNPCTTETGKVLWDLLDKKHEDLVQRCMEKFPREIENVRNVRFGAVTTSLIVPDKVYAYTNRTQIYIINATLTIISEPNINSSFFEVYNQDISTLSSDCLEELNKSSMEYSQYVRELNERMILPYVIADVNQEEKYEDLRDVYVALALAQWYKSRINPHMDIFREDLESSRAYVLEAQRPWSPKEIWDRYIYSYKNGEYKCWKNTTIETASGTLTKSSLRQAGGVDFSGIHLVNVEGIPEEVQNQVNEAIINGFSNEGEDVLFGNRLHVDQEKEEPISSSSLNGSGTDTETDIHDTEELVKSESPALDATSNTCPEGWMGPDESGECWKLEIVIEN